MRTNLPGDWLLSVPVWGERYLRIFEQATLPALKLAAEALGRPTTLLVHSDDEAHIRAVVGNAFNQVIVRPVPGADRAFASLSDAHREAMRMARPAQRLCLLTADLVMSRNSLYSAERHFQSGKLIFCCAGVRADDAETPPIGANGPTLAAWTWAHRHPMTRECTWPDGRSYDLWRVYFERDGNVTSRVNLPHPLALVSDGRQIHFSPTIDVNVVTHFRPREIQMVTDPAEAVLTELSPHDKEFLMAEYTMRERFEQGGHACPEFIRIHHSTRRWLYGHPIRLVGNGDASDPGVVARMLS